MAGKVLPAQGPPLTTVLILDADGRTSRWKVFKDLDTARRRLPALAAQFPARKSPFGMQQRAPSWRKPMDIDTPS